jgi:hypothetical protein
MADITIIHSSTSLHLSQNIRVNIKNMTINTKIAIEWSKIATSRNNHYSPEIRQLMAVLLISSLKGEWLHPGRAHIVGEAAKISAITFRKLNDLDPKITDVLYCRDPNQSVLAPRLEVAKFYQDKIFGFKGGIVRKLQGASKNTPKSNTSEQRLYIEKITAIWHELVEFPPELTQETNSGIFLNLRDNDTDGDLQAISEYIIAMKLDSLI